jgi:hypothetical protein
MVQSKKKEKLPFCTSIYVIKLTDVLWFIPYPPLHSPNNFYRDSVSCFFFFFFIIYDVIFPTLQQLSCLLEWWTLSLMTILITCIERWQGCHDTQVYSYYAAHVLLACFFFMSTHLGRSSVESLLFDTLRVNYLICTWQPNLAYDIFVTPGSPSSGRL